MVASMAAARASTWASWVSFRLERMDTVSSKNVMFFAVPRISRMSRPLVGAQLPFSRKATVRFWMLWAARSRSSSSMLTKIPAL